MTSDAFLRAIVENPDDLDTRLIFADWLDENGDPARAEFIRAQCEVERLARWPCGGYYCNETIGHVDCQDPTGERRELLRRRERELLDGGMGLGVESLPVVEGLTRGNFLGDGHSGWHHTPILSPEQGIRADFRRGFVECITCSCASWLAHGRGIVLSCPVRQVVLAGRKPHRLDDIGFGWWRRRKWSSLPDADDIPEEICELLRGRPGGALTTRDSRKWFDTEAEALADLSRAAIQLARRQAGLPEWEPAAPRLPHLQSPPI
jgi:uncharacterized protein (TIGR02996 family)